MKIVIVSDTHLPRFRHRLADALAHVARERPQAIFHCGDITEPGVLAPFEAIAPLDAVAGNNDGPELVRTYGRRKIVACGGLRIGLVHGDGSAGTTLSRALAAFAHAEVDVVAFGHSHIPYLGRDRGRFVVNPGSLTDKRRQPRYSFAVLEIDRGVLAEPRLVFFDANAAA